MHSHYKATITALLLSLAGLTAHAQHISMDTTKGEVYTFVEQMPEFPGGNDSLLKYLHDNIVYPADARASGAEGRVAAQFIVNEDGHISDIRVFKSVYPSCDSEVVSIISRMPRWKPGMQNGVKVKVYYILPVTFKLNDIDYMKPSISLPAFAAGDDSLQHFFSEHLVYPKAAKKAKVQGIVTLSFNVDTLGKVQDITVYKSLGSGCDEEAIRLLKSVPRFVPGTKEGQPALMPYYANIEFVLKKK